MSGSTDLEVKSGQDAHPDNVAPWQCDLEPVLSPCLLFSRVMILGPRTTSEDIEEEH
jgi:hypothetical protein